jgi:hypothetical protein
MSEDDWPTPSKRMPLMDMAAVEDADDWIDRAMVLDFADPIVHPPKLIYDPNEPMKRCKQCYRRKPLSYFPSHGKSASTRCRGCLSLLPYHR